MSNRSRKQNRSFKRDCVPESISEHLKSPEQVLETPLKCYFCGSTNGSELSSSTCSSSSSGVSSDLDYHNNWKNDPVAEKVSLWLNDNPEFCKNYFIQNANRSWIESWKSYQNVVSSGRAGGDSDAAAPANQSSSSGSNTPVRKISSQEFDMVGLRPIVSTNSDGSITFLSPNNVANNGGNSTSPSMRRTRRRRSAYKDLDEHEFLQDLIKDLCDDLDLTSLGFKILQNVSLLLEADRCSLFLIEEDFVTGQRFLVSKLFDVTVDCCLDDIVRRCQDNCIRIPLGQGIMGHVAQSGMHANIEDAYKDERFNDEVDRLTGYVTKCLLCMPLKDSSGNVLGVAQAVNKLNCVHSGCFSVRDVKVFQSYLSFCGMSVKNAQIYRQSQLETRRNQVVLDLAKLIFEEQSSMRKLMFKIMMHTQSLLQCGRVQILLLGDLKQKEEKIFSRVYEYSDSGDKDEEKCESSNGNSHFPINIGITGYVARTGETINIDDVYNDARFDKSSDEASDGYRTVCILCMPIKNAAGDVLCVCQLINKTRGHRRFTQTDIHLLEAFGLFCGLGIHNTHMYEEISRAVARQRITLEILSYHAIAPLEDANRMARLLVPSARYFRLNQFTFSDFEMNDDETIKGCIRMFIDLNLITLFNIDYMVLCRWLLSVKRNYRPVTYHNWRHAFNVAQTMFTMISTGKLNNIYSNVEILALLIACLCHDLDHRGTNNQFQVKSMSPLAELYSTSVLEHHHFDQCLMILNTKGSDILCNLFHDDYQRVVDLVEEAILATDLAIYFQRRKGFFELVEQQQDTQKIHAWENDEDRRLLRCMSMTACDVAAITKPWSSQRKIAELVASEFFEQGDLEKSELKLKPIEMMDRDKKDELPRMQVEFIDQICLPLYQAISRISAGLNPLLDGCLTNRQHWEDMWKEVSTANKDL